MKSAQNCNLHDFFLLEQLQLTSSTGQNVGGGEMGGVILISDFAGLAGMLQCSILTH